MTMRLRVIATFGLVLLLGTFANGGNVMELYDMSRNFRIDQDDEGIHGQFVDHRTLDFTSCLYLCAKVRHFIV